MDDEYGDLFGAEEGNAGVHNKKPEGLISMMFLHKDNSVVRFSPHAVMHDS